MAAYHWVDSFDCGGLPTTAIPGGVDIDGHQIYVGRAWHNDEWIPAKVIPGRRRAYICAEGREVEKKDFQVLCEQRFDWVPARSGHVPDGAVDGGRTIDGEVLYIGRANHLGSKTLGKVHPSYGLCFIPFGGKELHYEEYEVLVLRS